MLGKEVDQGFKFKDTERRRLQALQTRAKWGGNRSAAGVDGQSKHSKSAKVVAWETGKVAEKLGFSKTGSRTDDSRLEWTGFCWRLISLGTGRQIAAAQKYQADRGSDAAAQRSIKSPLGSRNLQRASREPPGTVEEK